MTFFPPIPLIRKNHINKINERLIKQKVLVKTKDGKYYLNK